MGFALDTDVYESVPQDPVLNKRGVASCPGSILKANTVTGGNRYGKLTLTRQLQ